MGGADELSAKVLERNVLEAELDDEELWESEEFQRLEREIAALREEGDAAESEPR